jgi:hypothetical protein
MTILPDPKLIPPNKQGFKTFYQIAGFALEELEEQNLEIQTQYYLNNNSDGELKRKVDEFGLKLEAECLRDVMRQAWCLWCQLKDEMCE